jgi:hypothetical protein
MYFVGKHHDDERIFLRNYRKPWDYEAFSYISMSYAAESNEYNDVVFVGDSAVRGGLDPRQFEQETGLKAYNLGNVGLIGISGYTEILDAYLRSHPKPRLVVLSVQLITIGADYLKNESPDGLDVRARFHWCYGSGTEDTRPHNSFLYHARQGFKYEYGLLLGGFEHFADVPINSRGDTLRTFQSELSKQRGFGAIPDTRKRLRPIRDKDSPKAIRDKDSDIHPTVVSDEWKKDLAALIRLAANHGIDLLIRFMPFEGETAELSPRLHAFAKELESQYATVAVSRPEVLRYDPAYFVDGFHLDAKGIEKFTTFAAAEVKTVLARRVGQGPQLSSSKSN